MNGEADVTLRAAGACVVIDLADGVPRLLHYGRDIGPSPDVDALRAVLERVGQPGSADVGAAPGLVPTAADGWAGAPGIAGHHAGRQLLPQLVITAVERSDGIAGGDGGGRVTITTADAVAGIEVVSVVVLEPSGVLRIRHTVTNRADAIFDLASLDVSAPVPPVAVELLDLTGRWCRERAPQRAPVLYATHQREVRRGRSGHDSPLLLTVGSAGFGFGRGEVWAVHLEWSGDQRYAVERLPEGAGAGSALLRAGELVHPGEIRLATGEEYATPWVLFTWSADGLDGASARIHRHVRARPSHPRRPRPVTVNTWEAVYFDHDLERLRELARRAAAVGVERFVLDDGWFRARRDDTAGLGDWTVDPTVWPDGLHPLVDEVRSLGMEFGLWVEPEMVNPDSDLARAHPDWILGPAHRAPRPSRHQQVLDLARPDVADHLFGQLDALVGEYRLDAFKWDHNRDLVEAVDPASGVASVHRQTTATYALLDRLRAAHPGLEIESCASGGGRVDLGALARTDRVWASDTTDAVERQLIQRWTASLLPPELIGCHVGPPVAHTTGRHVRLGFRCLTSLFGHAGVEWDLTVARPDELDRLRRWIAVHVELRSLLHHGDVVRGDDEPDGLLVHGVVAADRRAAAHAVVRLATGPEAAPGPVRLPGLDPERRYVVRPRHDDRDIARQSRSAPRWWTEAAGDGLTVAGAVLVGVGLQLPPLEVGDGVLVHAVAVG